MRIGNVGWKAAIFVLIALVFCQHVQATVNWTGASGTSWATGGSWSNSSGPGTTDTASFSNTGSVTLSGTDTSILNTSRTIGGLAFNNTAGNYQTLNLNGFTLTDTGNLNFNTDQSSTTTTTVHNGTLNLTGGSSNFFVGSSVSQSASGSADLSTLSALNATIENLYVGNGASGGNAFGMLMLPPTDTINATTIIVGSNSNGNSNGVSSISLGNSNTISTGQLIIAQNYSSGAVTLPTGGALTLGSAGAMSAVNVAVANSNTDIYYTGLLDLSQGSFTGYFSSLIVGQQIGPVGSVAGTFNAGRQGTLTIGAAGTSTASFIVGNSTDGGNNISGTVNLAGLSTFTANLGTFGIGTTTNNGTAAGNVTLAASNTINASSITVGSNTVSPNSGNNGTLTLGNSNNIQTSQLTIAQNVSSGSVTLPANGSLTLGAPASLTAVSISNANSNTPNSFTGLLDLSQGSFTGYLSNLIVAQQIGSNGSNIGTFNAGSSGSVLIGSSNTSTANIIVANGITGGNVTGTANFGGLASLTANLNTFSIGTSGANNAATGSVTLAAANTITTGSITVGSSTNGSNSATPSTLTLGKTNTIITSQMTIALNEGAGSVTLPSGGSLILGSAAHLTALSIATANNNSPNQYTGVMDLSLGSFTGYLSSLTVGQQTGTNGLVVGTFNAGNSGTVTIGTPNTSTANIIVGSATAGASGIQGTANFGGLGSLTAYLNSFTIGTASASGGATGSVTLASSNNITASSITVGSSGNGTDGLAFGYSNTILTSQFTIGQDYSTGSVTVASGGSLTLGSPASLMNLSIGVGTTNTGNTYGGSLVASNSTVTAYLGNVVIGSKNAQPGTEVGTLTIGNSSANYITATSIVLGGTQSTGTLNYGGGKLFAGTFSKGAGTANFNWTGGALSVGTFGTVAIPFNLSNTGSGTLAPGTAASTISTTNIYGNYVQGAAATTALDINGTSPGSGYDQINISGTASLAGTIALNIGGGYTPSVGDAFLLETYASETGTFSKVIPPSLPAGVAFQLDYSSPTQLVMELVTPATQNFLFPSTFSTFGTSASWSPQGVPGTASSAYIINSATTSKTVTVSSSDTLYRVDVQGTVGKADLEISNGVTLATANQVIVDSGATMNIQSGGAVIASAGLAGAGATTVVAGGSLTAMSLRQSLLTVDGVVKVPVATPRNSGATISILGQLTIAGSTGNWTGSLDLGNNDLDVTGGSLATLTDQIKLGYNAAGGGNWAGLGISSSAAAADPNHLTALGIMQNNQSGIALYGSGHPFDGTTPGAADILIKYTYYGDTNLDGKVDGSDYARIDNAYLNHLTGWFNGDFNYDGVVNGSDYTLIDNAFNTQGTQISSQLADLAANATAQVSSAAVPEPASCVLFVLPAIALISRRGKYDKR